MNKTYVIYLRKSRADMEAEARGEGETLARHERTLLDLAKRQKLPIGAIYREIVSGETIAARPQMQQLLSEVERGIWTGVLVMEVERLARGDTMDQGLVSTTFKYSGTKIITPMKTYDPLNEFDEEYFEFGLFMSRREYKTINRRLQAGRLAAVKEGKFVGNTAPYGWKKVKLERDSGYSLEPHETNYDYQLMMYDMVANGSLLRDVCNRLESLSIPSPKGQHWTTAVVRDILRNPHNDGMVRWGWRKNKTIRENGQVRKARPRGKADEVMLYPGLHKEHVRLSHATYMKVQEILDARSVPAPEKHGVKNPLAGVVVCGCCGHNMIRRSYASGKPAGLICAQHHCQNVSSVLDTVEHKLIKALEVWLDGYKVIVAQKTPEPSYDKHDILADLLIEKDKLLKQNDKIHDLLEKDVYTIEQFLERSRLIIEKLEKSETAIAAIKKEIQKDEAMRTSAEEIIPRIQNVLDNYWQMDIPTRNAALKEILEKVEYTKNKRGHHKKTGSLDNFSLKIYPKIPKKANNPSEKDDQKHHGTKEMAHAEIIATMVHQLTDGASAQELKNAGIADYYVDHTNGIYPASASGNPFTAAAFQSKGDPITDLMEDMAAEQKARTTYENLMRLATDPEVYKVLKFLRAREIVHFQRFGEALEFVRKDLNSDNYYAYNPAFDRTSNK